MVTEQNLDVGTASPKLINMIINGWITYGDSVLDYNPDLK